MAIKMIKIIENEQKEGLISVKWCVIYNGP